MGVTAHSFTGLPTNRESYHDVSQHVFVHIFLPIRTAKEGIQLANNTNYGLGSSVWTEKISLALETAISLKVKTEE